MSIGDARIGRIVDLTMLLDDATPVYPGDPAPRTEPAATIESDGFNVLTLHVGSHSGTHVDAPLHIVPDGASLEALGLDRLAGRGVIADVTGLEPRAPIGWKRLEPYADRLGPDAIFLLHTGWSESRLGPDYLRHPYLEPSACERVLELGVRTLAIDALNPDPTEPGGALPVHELMLGAGGVIAENLTNLSAVDFEDPLVLLLPLRLGGQADGAPARAIAVDLRP